MQRQSDKLWVCWSNSDNYKSLCALRARWASWPAGPAKSAAPSKTAALSKRARPGEEKEPATTPNPECSSVERETVCECLSLTGGEGHKAWYVLHVGPFVLD